MNLALSVRFVGVQCRVSHVPVNYHVWCFKVQQVCSVGVIQMQLMNAGLFTLRSRYR